MVDDGYGYLGSDPHSDDTGAFVLDATEGESPPDGMGTVGHVELHQPSIDFDGDGQPDDYVTGTGPQGEQMYVHTDAQGRVDAIAVDVDHDGMIDRLLVDSDGDGTVDQVLTDTDGDGFMDPETSN